MAYLVITCTSAPSFLLITGIRLAVSAIAQPAVPTKEMVVTPFEQVKFVPIDPIKPNGNPIAVAEGNPAIGQICMPHAMQKFGRRAVPARCIKTPQKWPDRRSSDPLRPFARDRFWKSLTACSDD
jgi:hypothetical protein